MEKITSALKPTARRTELGNELRANVDVLCAVRDKLFDPAAKDGRAVQRSVEGFLQRKLAAAPKRGKGARKRRFLEHCVAVHGRWKRGLYVCFDRNDVPHTSNAIEGAHGRSKHHVRRVTGRASTAGGPFESYGELLYPLLLEAKLNGVEALCARAEDVTQDEYREARRTLDAVMEPARRLRSAARRTAEALAALVEKARLGLKP